MNAPVLKRTTFVTSRQLEFCSRKELVLQTGHTVEHWPLVIAKELIDNGIDACEESGVAPQISVTVSTETGRITVTDNGPGMPPETIKSLLDFTVRVSSREAYASPARGAQGNALKTLVAMPFAIDGMPAVTIIEAQGVRHVITFTADSVRQVPVVTHETGPSDVKNGNSVTVQWPPSSIAHNSPS
jgi:DNA topoisomerase VI subunit B